MSFWSWNAFLRRSTARFSSIIHNSFLDFDRPARKNKTQTPSSCKPGIEELEARLTPSTASFVKADTTTAGNWQGVYGTQGSDLAAGALATPSYAQVSLAGEASWTWAGSTTDPRALQTSGGRIAATWYSASSFNVDVNLTDGQTHGLALYLVDWDSDGRSEQVSILNSQSGAVLASQTVSSFVGGEYLLFNVSGNIDIQISNLAGANAVLSGLFLDSPYSASQQQGSTGSQQATNTASFVKADTTTEGNWQGVYGSTGSNVIGSSANYPSYAQVTASGQSSWTWAASTTDPRALQTSGGRIAATWYSASSFNVDVDLTDGQTHGLALYLLDWDSDGRSEQVNILNPQTGAVLASQTVSSFVGGEYLLFNVSGNIDIQITNLTGANAVLSGLFLDPQYSASQQQGSTGSQQATNTASFVKADTTTAGNWQGVYGSTGSNVIGSSASYPSYAEVTASGQSSWTWAASTTDPRALQTSGGRIAATWYSASSFNVDVDLTDGQTHGLALYLLDWDSDGRSEQVNILNPQTGAVLASQTVSSFVGGEYLLFNVSGNIDIQITKLAGANAVLSGLFLNPQWSSLVVNAGANESGNEGSAIAFSGTASGGSGALSYSWNFGDGSTAMGSLTPSHTYAIYGTYTATLTVTDAAGDTSQSSSTVTVNDVAPTVTIQDPTAQVGTAIPFGAVASSPSAQETAAGYRYSWNFGDGSTTTQQNTSHAYTSPGVYTVSLTVTDEAGLSTTVSTTATINPSSSLVVNAGANESGNEGSAVQFNGTASGGSGALSYAWNFGDGSTTTGSLTPSHVYANYGTYTATLTVTDSLGDSSQSSTTVTVNNFAPTATLSSPSSTDVGSPVTVSFSNPYDPSNAATQAGFHYSFALTQSALATSYASAGTSNSASFTFNETGTYTVYGRILDENNNYTDYTTQVTPAQIMGYNDPGLTVTGVWSWDASNGRDFGAEPGDGSSVAQWQAAVMPGTYEVWATWIPSPGHASNAPYSILDGGSAVATVDVNQHFYPLGIQDGGLTWQELGVFSIQSGQLAVQLSNAADNVVIAQGIRFQADNGAPVSPALSITGMPDSGTVPVETPITLGSEVIDPDVQGNIQYAWSVTENGQPYATGNAATFTFTPDNNGAFQVSLTVTAPSGASATVSADLTVTPVPPTLSVASSFSGKSQWQVDFAATGTDVSPVDAASLVYSWNFGDGSTGTGATPTHVYEQSGTYSVTVSVVDQNGFTASATTTAQIASLGPAASYIVTPYLNIPDFGYDPTIVNVQNGNWSNPATWSLGRVPQAGDIVDINPGTTVTYDVNDTIGSAPLNTVEVKAGATLTFSTSTNTQMYVVNIMVLQGGTLDIGTQANPIPSNITANVVWVNQAINTALDPEQYGNGLIVLGTMNTYGAVKAPYVTLAQNANAGATVLHLASPATGWQVGDKLQLPDTRQLGSEEQGSNYTPQWESMTIQSISADGLTITLTAPLQYNHLGGYNAAGILEYLPQVVDMTRNVSIHSQSATGTRGYALFTGNADVNINYTNFSGMGRTTDTMFMNQVAAGANVPQGFDNTTFDANGNITNIGTNEENRNAITFLDLIGPSSPQADGYQFTFNGNVVTCPLTPMPFIWGINVVNSSYGLIQNNDVVNWAGSGIEVDYQSIYNNFNGNFVMRINGTGGRGNDDMGFGGDGLWFGNSINYVTNNIVTDIGATGPYGYAYQFFVATALGGQLGYVNVAAYQGADPSQPGQSTSVDLNLQPVLDFTNNEAYGVVPVGMSFWCINYDPGHPNLPLLPSGGVIQGFVVWNLWETGILGYQANNLTVNDFVDLGNAEEMAGGLISFGFQFQDYYTGNMVIENADIENLAIGILAPDVTGGTVTIENCYLADQTGILVGALWSVNEDVRSVPSRTIVLDNDQFVAPLAGQPFTAIDMNWYQPFQLADGGPIAQLDQVFVYNYNGVSGDNFQLFYSQQAANFVVPQTEHNSDGTVKLLGAPVAGLTNAQAWAQYGVAIAGGVAPANATTMDNIVGLVAPI